MSPARRDRTRAARRRLGLALLAGLGGAAACARVRPLEGGPPDLTPPRLLAAVPADSSTGLTRTPRFEFDWSEKLSTRTVRGGLRLYPPARIGRIERSGTRLVVALAETLPPDTLVAVVLGRTLQDLPGRDNRLPEEIWLLYSTGPQLHAAAALGKVTAKGKPDPHTAIAWEPVPPDSGRDATRQRRPTAVVDAEGLFRLPAIPPDRPFRLVAFVDRNGDLNRDEDELTAAYPETLRLADGEVRRGLTWNIRDPREPGVVSGVVVNRSGVPGALAVALRALDPVPPPPGARAATADTAAAADSAVVRADTVRPLDLPVPPRQPAAAWAQLEPRGFVRREWRVVYASPRGDYSVQVAPGAHALIAFVDARRDSAPGLRVLPDSAALAWEPLWWGGVLQVEPGAQLRPRAIEIEARAPDRP